MQIFASVPEIFKFENWVKYANEICFCSVFFLLVPYGLAIRIPGFHPGGPGSTVGMHAWESATDMSRCFILRLSEDR